MSGALREIEALISEWSTCRHLSVRFRVEHLWRNKLSTGFRVEHLWRDKLSVSFRVENLWRDKLT